MASLPPARPATSPRSSVEPTPGPTPVAEAEAEQRAAWRARARELELSSRRQVRDALQGAYRSSFKGSGVEFEEVRPYQAGDDVRSIDWNVTARAGRPYVKSFAEDRQLVVHFIVDARAPMDFGSAARSKRDAATELVGLVSAAAARQRDPFGLDLYRAGGERVHLAPGRGEPQLHRVVSALIGETGAGSAHAGQASESHLTEFLEGRLRVLGRARLLFLVGGFDELCARGSFEPALAALGARHDLVLVRIVDPFEERLPRAGLIEIEDPVSGRALVDTGSARVRRAWEDAARARREAWLQSAARARAETLELSTAEAVHGPLLALFQRRAARRGARP